MKYVYCLTRNIESIDAIPPGLGGMKVYQVSLRGLTALVSDVEKTFSKSSKGDHAETSLLGNPQNALVHHVVVEIASRLCTSLIPCRFGSIIINEEKILSLLRKHHARLEYELARLEGKLEVSVRAVFSGTDAKVVMTDSKGLTGNLYLLEKKQRFDAFKELKEKADRFSLKLNEATTPFWTEVKSQKQPINNGLPHTLLSLYYLVEREKLSSFKCAYQQFKENWPSLKLLYTGPWPPYSFTDIDLRNRSSLGCAKV